MHINTKFNINNRVKITELNLYGRIKDIWITRAGVEYNVSYFYSGVLQSAYVIEDELQKV